jgi:hypothetical protein
MTINPTLINEIESLPENRQADVLAFVRFLKISLVDEQDLERAFIEALDRASALAEDRAITEQDINHEIEAVRSGK